MLLKLTNTIPTKFIKNCICKIKYPTKVEPLKEDLGHIDNVAKDIEDLGKLLKEILSKNNN